jgi:hypothetical protein
VRSVFFRPATGTHSFRRTLVFTRSSFKRTRVLLAIFGMSTGSDEAGGVGSWRSVFSTSNRRSNYISSVAEGCKPRRSFEILGRRLDTVRRRLDRLHASKTRRERFGWQGSAQSNVSQDPRTSRARDAPKFFRSQANATMAVLCFGGNEKHQISNSKKQTRTKASNSKRGRGSPLL